MGESLIGACPYISQSLTDFYYQRLFIFCIVFLPVMYVIHIFYRKLKDNSASQCMRKERLRSVSGPLSALELSDSFLLSIFDLQS